MNDTPHSKIPSRIRLMAVLKKVRQPQITVYKVLLVKDHSIENILEACSVTRHAHGFHETLDLFSVENPVSFLHEKEK